MRYMPAAGPGGLPMSPGANKIVVRRRDRFGHVSPGGSHLDIREITAALPDLDLVEVAADVNGTEDDLLNEAVEVLEDVEA